MDSTIIDPIEYGRVGKRTLTGTLYRPASPPDHLLPIILWVHGGAWMHGTRHDNADLFREMVAQGFACFSISYRLSHEAIFPAAIMDCKCAVRYLRANAAELGIQAENIGAWGPSAGGHLVALLGTSANVPDLEGDGGWAGHSSAVQAVCDWFGPSDFLQMSAYPSDIDHDAPDAPESLFIGNPIQQHPDLVQRANPITYITAATPPMLIAHGKQDRIVPINQSELLYEALVAQGVEVTFEQLEAAGHGGAGFEPEGELFATCIDFFKRHLMPTNSYLNQ